MHAVAPMPTLTYAKADYHAPVAQRDLLPLANPLLAELSGGAQSRRRAGGAMAQCRRDRIGAPHAAAASC